MNAQNLKLITEAYPLKLIDPTGGMRLLGAPLGSKSFVESFLLKKFADVDAILDIISQVPDSRIAFHMQRVTASVCQVNHLMRLMSPDAAIIKLWHDFDDRQSLFFEKTSDIPMQATVRAQVRLPFPLAGIGLYSAADLSPCAYVGSLVDTARLRADGRKKSPLLHEIMGKADPILQSLRPYLQTLLESLPLTTLSLQVAPESSQNELSQAFFRKRAGIVALEAEWELLKDKSDADMDWNVVHSRRRIMALREPGAN